MTRFRWLRLALPFAVVLALVVLVVTAHLVQRADPTDPAFLSPTSTGDVGAATLADRLTRGGVAVERQTNTLDALAAAGSGDVTLFIPAPGLVYREYLALLAALPSSTRVVLVAPDFAALGDARLDVALGGPRWTAAAPAPGCAEPWASGPAAVLRWRYATTAGERFSCYGGGVLELAGDGAPVTLVGAADPFRNDRLGEHANAAFAVGLLARTSRVVWLDLHQPEPPPPGPGSPDPDVAATTAAPGQDGPGQGQGQGQEHGQGPTGGDQDDDPQNADRPPPDNPDNPLFHAFPPAVWAALLLLALAAIALAAASARRLGAPVAEPLPVRVRAAETVRGLGDLYRRAGADDASLATIQAAARRRLAEHLGLPLDSTAEDLAGHLAALPAHQVQRLLGDSDQDLASTAEAVQNLVRHVKGNVT